MGLCPFLGLTCDVTGIHQANAIYISIDPLIQLISYSIDQNSVFSLPLTIRLIFELHKQPSLDL